MVDDGLDGQDIADKVRGENLFQYPSERSSSNIAQVCRRRIEALGTGPAALQARELLAHGTAEQASQLNVYLLMRSYRLVREFMLLVVARKLEMRDYMISRGDIAVFLNELAQGSSVLSSWSEITLDKCRQVLTRCLALAGYTEPEPGTRGSFVLRPLLLDAQVEGVVRGNGDAFLLSAFRAGE